MRFLLAIIFLAGTSMSSMAKTCKEDLPRSTKGYDQLKTWLNKKNRKFVMSHQVVKYNDKGFFVGVFHDTGSGRRLTDVYLYACDKKACNMLAYRATDSSSKIHIELSKDKKTIFFKSKTGTIFLSLPFLAHD